MCDNILKQYVYIIHVTIIPWNKCVTRYQNSMYTLYMLQVYKCATRLLQRERRNKSVGDRCTFSQSNEDTT